MIRSGGRFFLRMIVLFLLLLCLISPLTAKAQTVPFVAGEAGGGWHTVGEGLARIINDTSSRLTIEVFPGGGIVNSDLVDDGSAQMGFGLSFMNVAASKGEDPYRWKHTNLRAVMGGMGTVYVHAAIDASIPARSVKDLFQKGRPLRIALPSTETSDDWIFDRILAYYHKNYKTLEKSGYRFFRGSYDQQILLLKEGKVDVVFMFLSLPAQAITAASETKPMRLLEFPDDLSKSLASYKINPAKIPRGTYPRMTNGNEAVTTASAVTTIIANRAAPDATIYAITKSICEHPDRVRKIHHSLEGFDPKLAAAGVGLPLHSGAERYYREKKIIK